jgi:U4/U6.U5 tri-snRNP-associated protein 2
LWVGRVEAELLSTKEAYVMVWERRRGNAAPRKK